MVAPAIAFAIASVDFRVCTRGRMVSFWFEADAVLGLNRDDLGRSKYGMPCTPATGVWSAAVGLAGSHCRLTPPETSDR